MKTYGGKEVYLHAFLTPSLDGGGWSASRSARFTPGEGTLGTCWRGGWVCPGAALDAVEKKKVLHLPGI